MQVEEKNMTKHHMFKESNLRQPWKVYIIPAFDACDI